MRKFFKEFKAFISRGNILDLSVAVIIGGAFTAIVTALTNKIIMPLINMILSAGGNGLESAYTFLKKVYIDDNIANGIDLDKSIYIDWGAFITAILNFFIIAFVIFIIMKIVNASRKQIEVISNAEKRAQKLAELNKFKELRAQARAEHRKYKEVKAEYDAKLKAEAEEKAKQEAEEKARQEAEEKLNNPTEQELLKEIRDLLAEKKSKTKSK